jgi:hypothetical protein
LNLRPPGPQPGALPDCATPRGASQSLPDARGRPMPLAQAGDGNRTRPRSLEGFCATTTLRPRGGDHRTVPGALYGVGVRLRALVFLLVLTAGDYLLWDWSIADGHDIVSLVAGLTLLPLAAVSLGQLVLAGGRLTALLIGRSSTPTRAGRASRKADAPERALHASASEPDSSSGKLAA